MLGTSGQARLTAVVLLLFAAGAVQCTPIRGVDPAAASLYQPAGGMFSCIDGAKAIPFAQVNDQYCDCFDGSDEPGTAACANGKFYCANVGFQPTMLNSSFVDDGVCDCCDGTDESSGTCPNTCKVKGEAALAGLRAQVAEAQAGLHERAKYVKAAATSRTKWQARLKAVAGLEARAKQRKQQTAAVRDRLEAQERRLTQSKTRLEQALKPPEPPAEAEAEAEAAPEPEAEQWATPAGGAAAVQAEAVAADTPAEGAAGAEPVEEAAASAEDLAKRVASQWIPGGGASAAAGEEDSEVDQVGADAEEEELAAQEERQGEEEEEEEEEQGEEEAAGEDTDQPEAGAEGGDSPGDTGLTGIDRVLAWAAGTWARVLGKEAAAADLKRTELALSRLQQHLATARKQATAASSALSQLTTERTQLEGKLGNDYGADGAFAPLVDRCIDAVVDKYTYRVCPYARAEQVEGGSATSLGSWKGFGEGLTRLEFTGGQSCWQGPDRSMTVDLRCGRTEALTRVAEPSRCEYTSEMTTPAACSQQEVAALQAQLEAKLALMRVAKDEL